MEEKIKRINKLAAKARTEGLTEEEIKERDILRKEYIKSVTGNLKAQLDNIDLVDEKGNVTPLKKVKKQ